jgi:hypothetical protein
MHQADDVRNSLAHIAQDLERKNVAYLAVKRIKEMKGNEWVNFVKLTQEHSIPESIDELYREGRDFTRRLGQLKTFTREVGEKYKSPDCEEVLGQLTNASNTYEKTSMQETRIEAFAPVFRDFRWETLKCYQLKPFFAGQKPEGLPMAELIALCHRCLTTLLRLAQEILTAYQENSLDSAALYHFKPKREESRDFRALMCFNRDE